jgi:hypothetical protein
MFGRKSMALGVLLLTQLLSGCWCCHRPFFFCRHRFCAPMMGDCSSCYQPNGGGVPTYPAMQAMPMNYIKSPPMPMPSTAPSNPAPGTIPSFPASATGTFTSMPVR